MKTWEKYIEYLLKGEWHIHTNYTDGKNSVYEYCQKATDIGIPLVAFTEHVRKNLDYNFYSFLDEIEKARQEFDLIVLSGCEAKVLPDGDIDVSDDVLKEIDYPIFAFHSFPDNIDIYLDSLKKVMGNQYVNAWAHPSEFFRRKHLEIFEDQFAEILNTMRNQKILLEINSKYGALPEKLINVAKADGVYLVRGSDVHNTESLRPV